MATRAESEDEAYQLECEVGRRRPSCLQFRRRAGPEINLTSLLVWRNLDIRRWMFGIAEKHLRTWMSFSAGSFRDFSKEKQDLPRLLGARELREDTRQAVIRPPILARFLGRDFCRAGTRKRTFSRGIHCNRASYKSGLASPGKTASIAGVCTIPRAAICFAIESRTTRERRR